MVLFCRRSFLLAVSLLALLGGVSLVSPGRADEDPLSRIPARTVREPEATASTTWAAVAYSSSTGRYGYGRGFYAEVNARRRALSEVGTEDARIVAVAGNSWVALALGDTRGSYGYGLADSAEEARRIALRECRKRTSNCYVAVCVSSEGSTAVNGREKRATQTAPVIVPAASFPLEGCRGLSR